MRQAIPAHSLNSTAVELSASDESISDLKNTATGHGHDHLPQDDITTLPANVFTSEPLASSSKDSLVNVSGLEGVDAEIHLSVDAEQTREFESTAIPRSPSLHSASNSEESHDNYEHETGPRISEEDDAERVISEIDSTFQNYFPLSQVPWRDSSKLHEGLESVSLTPNVSLHVVFTSILVRRHVLVALRRPFQIKGSLRRPIVL